MKTGYDENDNLTIKIMEQTVCSISPEEFECYCLEVLRVYAEKEKLTDFSIEHNVKVPASDGIYQIDVLCQFKALNVNIKVLVECKQYKKPVPREKVELLYSRLNSLGMHKGILISTSGFQHGAIRYAVAHGVALIQLADKEIDFIVASQKSDDLFSYVRTELYNLYPQYIAKAWINSSISMVDIYPSNNSRMQMFGWIFSQYEESVRRSEDACYNIHHRFPRLEPL